MLVIGSISWELIRLLEFDIGVCIRDYVFCVLAVED